MFRRFWADCLLASVLVSVALESSRGKSNTLEFDDPYKGFATFSCSQNDATAKRTCRKTCEFGLRTRSANRGQFSLDGSAVWRRFGLRFHSKIVPESMKMTSEEPTRERRASRELQDGSGDGRMAKSRTTPYQPVLVTRYGRGGSCCAKCIHLTESDESCTPFDTPARGRRIY